MGEQSSTEKTKVKPKLDTAADVLEWMTEQAYELPLIDVRKTRKTAAYLAECVREHENLQKLDPGARVKWFSGPELSRVEANERLRQAFDALTAHWNWDAYGVPLLELRNAMKGGSDE